MGLSGYAGAAAAKNLEELFAAQLKEELDREDQARLQEERLADRAMREKNYGLNERQLAATIAENAAQGARADRTESRAEAAARAAADKAAAIERARLELGPMVGDPTQKVQLGRRALETGVDLPGHVTDLTKEDLVPFETTDEQGNAVTRYLAKNSPEATRGVPKPPPPKPQHAPQYEWVTQPDGSVAKIRSDREISGGAVPYNKAGAKVTGVHSRALGFFNQARQADEDTEPMEPAIAKMPVWDQARMEWAPNFAQSAEGRAYIAAQRAFTEARLRKVSGAAVPNEEYNNDRKTFFAMPGDDEVTIQNKRRARAAVLASIGYEAGPALEDFYGDEAENMIGTYRRRAEKPSPGGGGGAPPAVRRRDAQGNLIP